MYAISNGYDIQDDLRRVGGTFDRATKCWLISDEAYAKLAARGPAYGMKWARGWGKATATKIGTPVNAAAAHDALYNEGVEGYNPHR